MRRTTIVCCLPVILLVTMQVYAQHEDLFVGHSPPGDGAGACPTDFPLQLFIADNAAVGGDIPPGGGAPGDPGALVTLNPVLYTALAAQPARGGYVFGGNQPGLNFISADNPCHGMSTSWTGGQYFEISLTRSSVSDQTNYGMTIGNTPILLEDGDSWVFGNSSSGGHMHPFFLAHRPGLYFAEFSLHSSIVFGDSDEFTLRLGSDPLCYDAVPVDLSAIFNADVVDSDSMDAPTSFDGAGHYWLLNGQYGTDRGLPEDGRLDVFQFGGPDGSELSGDGLNCLFDNGSLSSAVSVDLTAAGLDDSYLSLEMLLGASGDFTCLTGDTCDELTVTLHYAGGSDQVVSVKRLALPSGFDPVFVPIEDWYVSTTPAPKLSVGPSGTREGGGFERSTGSGIDTTVSPTDSIYFQRVTFPLDSSRILQTITLGDFAGDGNLGVFAITAIREFYCRNGDYDQDGDVDLTDYASYVDCMTGPGGTYSDPACATFDPDDDLDVDLDDFKDLELNFTGALD